MDLTYLKLKALYDSLARMVYECDKLWTMDEIVEAWIDEIMFPYHRMLWAIYNDIKHYEDMDDNDFKAFMEAVDFKGRINWYRGDIDVSRNNC